MPRIAGTERADLRLGVLVSGLSHTARHHGAVMLPVAAAAGGQAGVGILSQAERRSDGRKTNSSKQNEAEETRKHEGPRSVYAPVSQGDKEAKGIRNWSWHCFQQKNVNEMVESGLIWMYVEREER